jgi:uncharacterized protein (UPF0276 family)
MPLDYIWQTPRKVTPVGVGLKTEHFDHVLRTEPPLAFFEVHAENYMTEGGAHHRYLEAIAEKYALSVHGVGMSLGSAEGVDMRHVERFRDVIDRYKPVLVSEHLAWSVSGGTYLNDLLPLPMTEESLRIVTGNVNRVQDFIGRRLLIENPSSYLAFASSEMPELEFLTRLCEATGSGMLLDINNVYVSAHNMGTEAEDYLDHVPEALVGEIHLAGHLRKDIEGVELRIDDHGSRVVEDVWALYRDFIRRAGPRPTLVEWDTDVPAFETLAEEAGKAADIMKTECGAHV